jgi:hypothetical protein
MDKEALLVPYTLGRTVVFLMLREPLEYMLWAVFCYIFFFFFYIFPIRKIKGLGKKNDYREAVENMNGPGPS